MRKEHLLMFRFILIYVFIAVMIFSFSTSASATNGYLANGYSIKNKGLAGAGVALPLDSLAASINPAGMVFVGKRIDFGLTLFNPNREYTVEGGTPTPPGCPGAPGCPFTLEEGNVESDAKYFLIPSLGFNWMLNDRNSIGVSIYGNGGMNTSYDDKATFFGSTPTGVDLMQLFVAPTYAVKINPDFALGVSVIGAYQRFEAEGLEKLGEFGFSSDPSHLTNNGHDDSFGYGAKIGYLIRVFPKLSVGASYQTEIKMERFNKYKGLFAEHGDFDIPATLTAGLALQPHPSLVFVFDVQRIFYSDIKSVNNPLLPNLNNSSLGEGDGAGFGWQDMVIYKAGIQWEASKDLTLRLGYSRGEQPIPPSEVLLNILAPGVIQQHATVGLTKKMGSNKELNFALMHAFSNKVKGVNPLDTAQTIELKMDQWEISAGYSYTF